MVPPTRHIFSVDVEEYFHAIALAPAAPQSQWDSLPSRVDASTRLILDLLAERGALGTFFVVGWVAERQPRLVRAIADAGHEVASHSYWHRQVFTMTPDEFDSDVRHSKDVLEQVTGRAVLGFRAPSFSIIPGCEWALDVLVEAGFTYDSSLFPIVRRRYGYPGVPCEPHAIRRPAGTIVELPPATTQMAGVRIPAAGGAYLRQLPYALVAHALTEHRARGVPAMFYVHPWEVDAGQPRLEVPYFARLRHYRGLEGMLARLRRLVAEFEFTSVERALDVQALGATA